VQQQQQISLQLWVQAATWQQQQQRRRQQQTMVLQMQMLTQLGLVSASS
jgi:hypothetical protein